MVLAPVRSGWKKIKAPLQGLQNQIHNRWYLRYAPVILGASFSMARVGVVDARFSREYAAAFNPIGAADFARIRSARFVTWHDSNPLDNIVTWSEAIGFIREAPFDKEQVEFIMEKLFGTVISPEAFCVLTNVLLETFEVAEISPALRGEYQNFIQKKFNGGYKKIPLHVEEVSQDFDEYLHSEHGLTPKELNREGLKHYFSEYLNKKYPGFETSYLYRYLGSVAPLLQAATGSPFQFKMITDTGGKIEYRVEQIIPVEVGEKWGRYLEALDLERQSLVSLLNNHVNWLTQKIDSEGRDRLGFLQQRAGIVQNQFPGTGHPQVFADRTANPNMYLSSMQDAMSIMMASGAKHNPDLWGAFWGRSFSGMFSSLGGIAGEMSGFYFLDLAGHGLIWNIIRSLPFALSGSMVQASGEVEEELRDVAVLNFCMPIGGFVCDMPLEITPP